MKKSVTVYSADLPELRTRLMAVDRRFTKAGVPWRLTWAERPFVKTEEGSPTLVEMVEVTIERTELSFGHWIYRAAVVVCDGGAVVHPAPGVDQDDLPKVSDHTCDHCSVKRYRKYIYLLQHENTGEFRQVGKTCMADFCSATPSLLRLIDQAEIKVDDIEASARRGISSVLTASARYDVRRIVALALLASNNGEDYIPSNSYGGYTTAEAVRYALISGADDSAITSDQIDAVLDSIKGVDGDYGRNLRAACGGQAVPSQAVGIVASAVTVWKRAEREAAKPAPAKGYHGVIGEKITGITGTVDVLRDIDTMYGPSRLLVVRDEDNSALSWFGKVPYDVDGITLEEGQKITIARGRVKDHNKYGDDERTVLTRVTLSRA